MIAGAYQWRGQGMDATVPNMPRHTVDCDYGTTGRLRCDCGVSRFRDRLTWHYQEQNRNGYEYEELRQKLAAALQAEINAMDRVIALQDVLVEYMDVAKAGDQVIVGGGLWDRGMEQVKGYGDLPWGGKA
jgi:hypothetical protein